MSGRGICRCSMCIRFEFEDVDGVVKQGQLADPRTIKNHARRDNARDHRLSEDSPSPGQPAGRLETPTKTSLATQHLPPRASSTSAPQDRLRTAPHDALLSDGVSQMFEQLSVTDSTVQERIRLLSQIHSAVDLQAATVPSDSMLAFVTPPRTAIDAPSPLDLRDKQTASYISFKNWAANQLRMVEALPLLGDKDADGRRDGLVRVIRRQLERLPPILARSWEIQTARMGLLRFEGEGLVPEAIPPPPTMTLRTQTTTPPFVLCVLLVVSLLHSVAAVSRPLTALILALVKVVVFGAFTLGNTSPGQAVSSAALSALLKAIPDDVRTALSILRVEPDIVRFACCKTCFSIYLPDASNRNDPYPHKCNFQETDKPQCGAPLVRQIQRDGKTAWTALKTFPYRTFKSWLAEFLSRPGIEKMVAAAWNDLPAQKGPERRWKDIMDAPAIRRFLGPDGKTLFSVQENGEIHLVFSLFVDWFNPYGNKRAGKSHSVGGIYMACLNLPPHLRYRPENLYLVAIIPGPKEPQVDQLNRLLRPLVDELIELWHAGILLGRTADRSTGRVVRVAAIPLVCDLPALRKVAGFAHHSSKHFCSFCPLSSDDIGNVNRATWPRPRTWDEHIKLACEWRDAPTEAERNTHFSRHGLRWSELLRLEYWDPTTFALVDSMHNLFLGEFKHHCMQVFGIDTAGEKTPQKNTVAHTPAQQQAILDRIRAAIISGAEAALAKIRQDYLLEMAKYNGVAISQTKPTKAQIAEAFLKWFAMLGSDATRIRLPPVMSGPTRCFRIETDEDESQRDSQKYRAVFTGAVLQEVRKDITNTSLPSWIEPPPRNLGSPSHGKLKADHWRTIGTVSLVITLVRLWGSARASPEEQAVLENFVALAIAVDLATRRSMSTSRSAIFDQYMEKYVRGLRTLFDHSLVPNHHLSLHLKRCLDLFGPVHGWWSYPFERLNGMLQRLNTNSKTEDMPLTFMRYFYMGATLRWLMHAFEWPVFKVFTDLVSVFDTVFGDVLRGTRVVDTYDPSADPVTRRFSYDSTKESALALSVYDNLLRLINTTSSIQFQSSRSRTDNGAPRLPPDVQVVPSLSLHGVSFTGKDSSERNSFILFKAGTPDLPHSTSAGQISQIFYHRRLEHGEEIVEPFLLVKEYVPLKKAHEQLDPYRKFDHLNTKLYYNTFKPAPRLLRVPDVVSHFASLTYTPEDIGKECIVARSLDRS